MGYSIRKVNFETGKQEILYDFICSIEEADLLAQLAMYNKTIKELIVIMPGWNRGIKDKAELYNKALELSEIYKVS